MAMIEKELQNYTTLQGMVKFKYHLNSTKYFQQELATYFRQPCRIHNILYNIHSQSEMFLHGWYTQLNPAD